MGRTIEFYSVDLRDVTNLLADYAGNDDGLSVFWASAKIHPMANFSLHLVLPDDMDRLSQALQKQNIWLPRIFRNALVKQLWFDGSSASITLLSDRFTHGVAKIKKAQVEQVASEWVSPFTYGQPLQETAAYAAVHQLYVIAQDAVKYKRSLIMLLVG